MQPDDWMPRPNRRPKQTKRDQVLDCFALGAFLFLMLCVAAMV
jgi:hypothetical protein